MSEKPIFIKMKKNEKHRERLQDKTRLLFRVNLIASACCLVFAILCWQLMDIVRVIPQVMAGFAVLNGLNLLLHRFHNKLVITYNIASIMALLGSVAIVLYSGGINSPFIFILALIAALFGFGGVAGAAAGIAKVLFFVFLILLVVSFISRAVQGKSVT